MRKSIIKENKDKSGIYKWTNKITNDIYVGQSIDLAKRFIQYFNLSYLKNRETILISRALIKYGYSNFSLEILEYCDIANLIEREQYYKDKLNPSYNTLNPVDSSLGNRHSVPLGSETKVKISQTLKITSFKEKSGLFSDIYTKENLLKISTIRGYSVNICEKCDTEGFKLIGSFVSIKRAAKFLGISTNTLKLYINSGKIFKDRYKFI